MTPPQRALRRVACAAALLLASCGGSTTGPPDPDPDPGPGDPQVAVVTVSSPIDTVIAVGRTAQLDATAQASDGTALSATFTWSSSNPSVASVTAAGLVSAATTGRSVFSATADGVTGLLGLRVVDADLDGAVATITDPFAAALRAGLSAGAASAIASSASQCQSAGTSGNVLAVDACLSDAIALTGSTGDDTALLAVHDLFAQHAQRLLNLGG